MSKPHRLLNKNDAALFSSHISASRNLIASHDASTPEKELFGIR